MITDIPISLPRPTPTPSPLRPLLSLLDIPSCLDPSLWYCLYASLPQESVTYTGLVLGNEAAVMKTKIFPPRHKASLCVLDVGMIQCDVAFFLVLE